jgi:hypothetical protein
LGAAIKLASKDPRLNVVGRELALGSADGNFLVDAYEHTPWVTNKTPDWLSRIPALGRQPGDARPAVLQWLEPLPLQARTTGWWRTAAPPSAPKEAPKFPGRDRVAKGESKGRGEIPLREEREKGV